MEGDELCRCSIEEVVDYHLHCLEKFPTELEISECTGSPGKFSDYCRFGYVCEVAEEEAYEEAGEAAEGWPSVTPEMQKELETELRKVADDWASKHNVHPKFWMAESYRTIRVTVKDESGEWAFAETETSNAEVAPPTGDAPALQG